MRRTAKPAYSMERAGQSPRAVVASAAGRSRREGVAPCSGGSCVMYVCDG